MPVVVFSSTTFKLRYPEFSSVSNDLLDIYFSEASMYCNNTEASRVTDLTVRATALNMIVAHIAALQQRVTDGAPLVGRIASAGEGGVSVSTAAAAPIGTRAWFDQTLYGAAAWQVLGQYRHMLYVPATFTPTVYVPEA